MAKKDDVEKKVDWYQSHRPALTRVLLRALKKGTEEIQSHMNTLLEKYQQEISIASKTEALKFLRQPISSGELNDLYTLAYLLPDGDERDRIVSRLNAESYKHGWNRQRAMKEMVDIQSRLIVENTLKQGKPLMRQLTLDAFGYSMFTVQKSANIGFVLQPSYKLLEKSLTSTFNASSTIGYVRQVTYAMREAFVQGMISGKSTNDIAKDISVANKRELWVSKAYARTMLCEVSNEVEKEALEDAGLKYYTYTCTLDELTCPVCGSMDGKEYPLSKAQAGVNFPPMHRNCRCTTSPYLTDEAKKQITRIYSLMDEKGRKHYDEVPRGMTYIQWAKKYYPEGSKHLYD